MSHQRKMANKAAARLRALSDPGRIARGHKLPWGAPGGRNLAALSAKARREEALKEQEKLRKKTTYGKTKVKVVKVRNVPSSVNHA